MRKITDLELRFIDCYFAANHNKRKTYDLLYPDRLSAPLSSKLVDIKEFLNRPTVKAEIERRQEELKKEFHIREVDILERLWEEANHYGEGASHNARINALVWMGKHFGMFQEKKQEVEKSITYNIINYSEAPTALPIKEIEALPEPEEEQVSDVEISSY